MLLNIESDNELSCNNALKQADMRWSIPTAQAVLFYTLNLKVEHGMRLSP